MDIQASKTRPPRTRAAGREVLQLRCSPVGWVIDPAMPPQRHNAGSMTQPTGERVTGRRASGKSDAPCRRLPMGCAGPSLQPARMRTFLRNRVPGGTYFFTVNLARRSDNTLLVDHIDALRRAYRITCAERPFETVAIVILPEHLHALWRLPPGDADYSTRWRLLKGRFSHAVDHHELRNRSRRHKQEQGIWQRRYWEHTIRDDTDLQHHVDYIHNNPVKHGWCGAPEQWAFSSFQRHAKRWEPSL